MAGRYDVIFVGSSFAASFFLHEYLRRAPATARVLVLERGPMKTHAARMREHPSLAAPNEWTEGFVNRNKSKEWLTTLAFGGNSNCWVACTPRLLPEDFRMKTDYGVGSDWPISYDDLEPYYCRAEQIMSVSGSNDAAPYPRSAPYVLPPHRMSEPDRILQGAFPSRFFLQPTARPTVPVGNRPACCGSATCIVCPVDSKFTVLNSLMHLYRDPRVTLETDAAAQSVDITGDRATGVVYDKRGREQRAQADLVVLGANAIYNPHILLRSGLRDAALGRGLNEQIGLLVTVNLRGVEGFGGSTMITGLGYMLYGGDRRRDRAGALIETWNLPRLLRAERGKWRQRLVMKVVFEDLRQPDNRVGVWAEDPRKPEVIFGNYSGYTKRGMANLRRDLGEIFAALPVESVAIDEAGKSEGHIYGTTVMGEDPAQSVVDRHLVHHRVRNLVVLGSGAFPTCSPSNPTLTLSALSLWSADHLLSSTHPPRGQG